MRLWVCNRMRIKMEYMMMALESDLISEAILEVADSMDEIIEYGKDN